MLSLHSLLFLLLPCTGVFVEAQDYLPSLAASQVPQLSTFFQLLNSTPSIYERILQGNITVLAPSNDAFVQFNASNSADAITLETLLSYHCLQGEVSGAMLSASTAVFPTLLSNTTVANVTGGQVVEAMGAKATGGVLSALEQRSSITSQDILFTPGILHVIDKVLTVPQTTTQAVTAAGLSDFVALFVRAFATANVSISSLGDWDAWPDVTIFAPNSPEYSSNFSGWDNLTVSQKLDIDYYHVINGSSLYSPDLTNGTSFTTALGENITAYVINGTVFINDAMVTQSDLLTANGVLHVLEKPLNPNDTNAKPSGLPSSDTGSSGSAPASIFAGLSPGAKAGVGIGVAIGALMIIGLLALCIRRCVRRDDRRNAGARENPLMERQELASKTSTSITPVEIYDESSLKELSDTSEIREMYDGSHLKEMSADWPLRDKGLPHELQ